MNIEKTKICFLKTQFGFDKYPFRNQKILQSIKLCSTKSITIAILFTMDADTWYKSLAQMSSFIPSNMLSCIVSSFKSRIIFNSHSGNFSPVTKTIPSQRCRDKLARDNLGFGNERQKTRNPAVDNATTRRVDRYLKPHMWFASSTSASHLVTFFRFCLPHS